MGFEGPDLVSDRPYFRLKGPDCGFDITSGRLAVKLGGY